MARKPKRLASSLTGPLMQKAALYIRVSTHWQIDKDSLPVQREELINYCKYALNLDSFEVFEDAGYSAKNTERPAYQQMMTRLRSGEFSHLVVWKIDRISRNLIDFATMYDEMKRLGITFVSKNEQFDTSSAMGEAMLKIILVFAELERKVTSERVTAIMLSRAADGKWNGGRVPLGYFYDKETGGFSIVENEAVIVRMIYDTYDREKSLLVVSKMLNDMGIKTRRGITWSPVSVQGILRNPFYVGTYRYNYRNEAKTGNVSGEFRPEAEWIMFEDHHESIIERSQWERVASILTRNRRLDDGYDTYNRKNVHIFAGLIRCGECGARMTAQHDRAREDGWRPSIYFCSSRRRSNSCSNKAATDIVIGPVVFNFMANLVKAMQSFGATTSIDTLEKKLLRSKALEDIEHIEGVGLQELYEAIRRHKFPESEPVPTERFPEKKIKQAQEIDLLMSEKRRNERALARLQNLHLYGEDAITEKDYIVERKRITDDLIAIDARLELLQHDRPDDMSMADHEFIEQALNFIVAFNLLDQREVTYVKMARKIEARVLKGFLTSIVQNFCIKDGRIETISLKIGVDLRFVYKDEET